MKRFLQISGACLWLFLLVWLFAKCSAQEEYKITKAKWWGFGITTAAGFMDGAVEGFEFDSRKSFERKWGVKPHSFFGSKSYEMIDSGWERQFGVIDFYHTADDLRKFGYISGGIVIGIGGAKQQQKWFHYIYDFALSFAFSAAGKWAGMYYVREIDSF